MCVCVCVCVCVCACDKGEYQERSAGENDDIPGMCEWVDFWVCVLVSARIVLLFHMDGLIDGCVKSTLPLAFFPHHRFVYIRNKYWWELPPHLIFLCV